MKSEVIVSYLLVALLLISTFFVNVGFSSTLLKQKPNTSTPDGSSHDLVDSDTSNSLTGVNSLASLSINPAEKTVAIGQTFTVDVNVTDVVNLFSYEFRLTYNANVVNMTGPPRAAIPQAGTFLVPSDGTSYFIPVWTLNETSSYAPPNQTAHVGYSLLVPELGRSGNGILVTFTLKALAAGSTLLHLNSDILVDDTANPIPHSSSDSLITVSPPFSATIAPPSVVMDRGQSQLFNSTVSGGISPFSYQWYLNDSPVSGATNPTWTFVPVSAGSYNVYLNVTDNLGAKTKSNIVLITVNPPPSVTISPVSVIMDVEQSRLFTSTVSGGTSPYTYQWYLNGVPVSEATNPTWTFTPSSSGLYDVYVNVTDGVNFTAKSNIATVTVNPPVSVSVSPASVVMNVDQSQLFTSSVTNGTPPYAYKWYLNDTLVLDAIAPTWVFTPAIIGTYYVYVEVTDSVNNAAQSEAAQITVLPSTVNVHDVALETIINSKSGCNPLPTIGENGTLQINVTAHNLGDSSESFNVIVYANATEIQQLAVTDLAPGENITLAFDWSTAGFLKGNYAISAYAEPVAGETNTTDNTITGETVAIVIQGDINADGRVNILDMVRCAILFGKKYPILGWDPNADLNNDGAINIIDIVTVAVHFGETS